MVDFPYMQNGMTPLMWACTRGHLGVVGVLLSHGNVNVNAQDKVHV